MAINWIRTWDIFRALGVTLVWILALEAGLRLAGARVDGSIYAHDDLRRFRLRPHAAAWQTAEGETLVTINNEGFRDRERKTGEHAGVFRVAVIGDSTVAGIQVSQPETFTQVAERWASKLSGKRVEVLNFGVPNYNLTQQYLTLRDDVMPYRPDLVIEGVSLTNAILNSNRATCVNDSPYPYFVERGGHLELYDPAVSQGLGASYESVFLDFENSCDLILYGLKAWRASTLKAANLKGKFLRAQPLPDHFYERSLYPSSDPEVTKAWRISEETLLLMRDFCKARGVEFWLATMDVGGQVHPDPAMREQYRQQLNTPDLNYADGRLTEFAGRAHIFSLQCSPFLAAYAQRTGTFLHGFFNTPPNYGHLNAAGHAVTGEMLGRAIAKRLE